MTRTKFKKVFFSSLLALSAAALAAYAITTTPLAFGTIDQFPPFNGPADVRFITSTFAPGENNGWHSHPGLVTAVVTAGTLTTESGCGDVHTYNAGSAFTEDAADVHRAVNYGASNMVLYAVITVPHGSATRINYDGPVCGPPTVIGQCKDNGWMKYNYPRTFADQGECVAFVQTGK